MKKRILKGKKVNSSKYKTESDVSEVSSKSTKKIHIQVANEGPTKKRGRGRKKQEPKEEIEEAQQ